MARKKSITDTQILDMAYQIVIESGFKVFTARNIARHLNCSTQPIYLEFHSMGELKKAVMMRLQQDLNHELSQRYTTDPLVDLGLAFADFMQAKPAFYAAIFVQAHFGVDEVRAFLDQQGSTLLAEYQPVAALNATQRRNLLKGVWIVATGLGNLAASGFMVLTAAQRSEMLQTVVQDFISNGRFTKEAASITLDQTAAL